MMRTLTAVAASLGMLLAASPAHAQQAHGSYWQQGQFIISADRLFSLFSFTHFSEDQFQPGPGNSKVSTTTNGTAISLLGGSSPVVSVVPGIGTVISPFTVPRVGVDYVIAPNVTIGGNLIVFFTLGGNTGIDTTMNNGTTRTVSSDNAGQLLFGIEPRAGYILPLNETFSLWLRGGFSYYLQSSKVTAGGQTQTTTINQLALDLEPQFVATFFPHVGFTAGLTGDIPLTGGHALDTTQNNVTQSQSAWSGIFFFGITLGMFAHF